MRYLNVPTVTFTDVNGIAHQVKDRRAISVFDTAFELQTTAQDCLDEIASRQEIYGKNAEGLAYAILDQNVEKFVEFDFDISKLKKLNIPIVNE